MQLSAVLLARVIFFVESVDLNPRGTAYYPDIIGALVKRYNFQKYPQKIEEFDEQKGVTLATGKFGDNTIDKIVIYNWGLALDTTSSTQNSEALLEEALTWRVANLKLTYNREMIKRKGYVSHVTFFSDAAILSLNPVLNLVGQKIGKAVSANLKLPYNFEALGVQLGIDPEEQRIPVQVFSIERRKGAAFSEHKYFSTAPTPTDVHLELIKDFEQAALAQIKK